MLIAKHEHNWLKLKVHTVIWTNNWAEIAISSVWKAQSWNLFCFECVVHSFDSSVLAFKQSAVNPQCCAGCGHGIRV